MAGRVRAWIGHLAKYPWLWWALLLVWASVLFVLSANSALPSGPDFPSKDKVLHCIYFSGGAFCFLLGLWGKARSLIALRFALGGMAFTAIIGALDEFHQTFTPGRSGNDPFDWLADLSGGLLGAMIAFLFLQRIRRTDPAAAN